MARPTKLTESQWTEIERRLTEGEATRALAREYGVAESYIRKRCSAQSAQIKAVANQVIAAEVAFSALPVSAQVSAQSLINKLRSVSDHLAGAAQYGAMTANRLNRIAHAQVSRIDEHEIDGDQLRTVAALTATANEAAKTGLNLISANKGRLDQEPEQTDQQRALTPSADWNKLKARACGTKAQGTNSTP